LNIAKELLEINKNGKLIKVDAKWLKGLKQSQLRSFAINLFKDEKIKKTAKKQELIDKICKHELLEKK
jgi:hypothetical protein